MLMKLTGGRAALTAFFPLVRLATVGRRSGLERVVPLVDFTQGEEVILVASSFGRERHPAWYQQASSPGRGGADRRGVSKRLPRRAGDRGGAERERLLELANTLYAGYGTIRERTAGVREIPVLALRPR